MLGDVCGKAVCRCAQPCLLTVVPIVDLLVAHNIMANQAGREGLNNMGPVAIHPDLDVGSGGQVI
jgi:hypothetical protein